MNSEENAFIPADILAVDDTVANVLLLAKMLKERGHRVRVAPSGKLALSAVQVQPPDLILLDINMPEMNGYEVCEQLKANERWKDIPVLFISALNETVDKVKAFKVGGVDYINKPFQFEEVEARVETHLQLRRLQLALKKHNHHLEELVQEKVAEISNSQLTTIFALAKLAEKRDDNTGNHIEHTRIYCKILAQELQKHPRFQKVIDDIFVQNIFYASPLHDIGKVGIPDNILLKPGKLTPEEYEKMKVHTVLGTETLDMVRNQYPGNYFLNMGIAITRSHHEKWDGTGYPDKLAGESIPLEARIMAVADVYDALRSQRPYKPAFTHEQSCEIILGESGRHFDPVIIDVFKTIEKQFSEISRKIEANQTAK